MSNVLLQWSDGTTTKTYSIYGSAKMVDDKSQMNIIWPFPASDDNAATINSLAGQNTKIRGMFAVLTRADDFSLGTGSFPADVTDVNGVAATDSKDKQRIFLLKTIFQPGGTHYVVDEYGHTWKGRLSNIQFPRDSEDPLVWYVTFDFDVGKVPTSAAG